MGLFKPKKKDGIQVRPLTEQEIQKKLYGEFTHLPIGEEDIPSFPKFSSPTKPAGNPIGVAKPDSPDLFTPKPELAEEPKKEAELNPSAAKPKVPGQFGSMASGPRKIEPPKTAVKQPKPAVRNPIPWGQILSSILKGVGQILTILWLIPKVIVSRLYFYRNSVKKIAGWTLGIVLLFVIFMGIRYLNEKREKAMQTRPAVKVAEPAPVKVQPIKETEAPLAPVEPVKPEVPAVEAEKPVEPVRSAAPPAAEAKQRESSGRFVIQVATYVTEQDALRVAERLLTEKMPAFVQGLSRSGGSVYYSVFLGRFPSYQDAQTEFSRFKKSSSSEPFQDAFIRTLSEN